MQSLLQPAIAILLFVSVGAAERSVRELRFEPVDKKRERVVPVKVYISDSDSPQPVILFSHGLGGSRENSAFLGRAWAAAGYVAVFMQHAGSDSEVWRTAAPGRRFAALKEAAGPESAALRFADVPFVIDQLEAWNSQAEHPLEEKLDLAHIGMSGHSYGAVTTLAVAGRKFFLDRNYGDERIDAFLAMSPQPGKGGAPAKVFGQLTKPILCMTGTRDASPVDRSLQPADRRKVYEALPKGDKYQLVLDGAEHMAFGDSQGFRTRGRNPAHHPAIQQISLHFWNAYLKGNAASRAWLQSQQPISGTGLGAADVWEWK
jgi:dienelactone hydrolase